MSTEIKRRGGTTAQHTTFTGAERELTVDTTKNTVVVHDGTTAGGHPLAKESALTAGITEAKAYADTKVGAITANAVATSDASTVQAKLTEHASQLADTADNAALWRAKDGNPATIYPVPKSRLYPRIELVATQEGEGDPSLENIRPIVPSLAVGDVLKVGRTGKNLITRPYTSGMSRTEYGITFTVNADGSVKVVGTATAAVYFILCVFGRRLTTVNSAWGGYTTPSTIEGYTVKDCTLQTQPSGSQAYVSVSGGTTVDKTYYPQIEYDSTPTPYEPYSGADYDLLTAEQDFYGLPGAPVVVGAEAGAVTVRDNIYTFTGNEGVGNPTSLGSGLYRAPIADILPVGKSAKAYAIGNTIGACSHFKYLENYSGAGQRIYTDGRSVYVFMQSEAALTAADVKAFFAAQYAAGTPVVVGYQLATPITIPVTPPVIAALERLSRTEARQNVLTVTANDSAIGVQKQTVTYQKSPIRESDELAAAIAALV